MLPGDVHDAAGYCAIVRGGRHCKRTITLRRPVQR
jgi:hypothetical protein